MKTDQRSVLRCLIVVAKAIGWLMWLIVAASLLTAAILFVVAGSGRFDAYVIYAAAAAMLAVAGVRYQLDRRQRRGGKS